MDFGTLRRLLIAAAVLLPVDASANPAVIDAARTGDAAALEAALADGAGVEPAVLEQALYFAAQGGHAGAVAVLLQAGADPDARLPFGAPLHIAARGNHAEAVAALLDAGADPDGLAGEKGNGALHEAAERGSMATSALLLERGADVNLRNGGRLPPIHLAALKARAEMVAMLRAQGAEPMVEAPLTAAELDAADIEAGRVAAIGCTHCHMLVAGEPPSGPHLGPVLVGLYDRPKAARDDYAYSPAMAAQTGAWTADDLDRFLTDPTGTVPGTAMQIDLGLDRGTRLALIAYLRSLAGN